MTKTQKQILVLCTGNSCRSQMAEGWLRHFAGDKAEIYSAGVEPEEISKKAIAVMREAGIDISSHTSDHVNSYSDKKFDYIITVCDNAREKCPYIAGNAIRIHRNFPDPARARGTEEEMLNEYRKVRDMLESYSKEFVEKMFR